MFPLPEKIPGYAHAYRRRKSLIPGYNIFPAAEYDIGYLIDTGLIQGFSQTFLKPRETRKIIVVGASLGCAYPRILHIRVHKHYATLP